MSYKKNTEVEVLPVVDLCKESAKYFLGGEVQQRWEPRYALLDGSFRMRCIVSTLLSYVSFVYFSCGGSCGKSRMGLYRPNIGVRYAARRWADNDRRHGIMITCILCFSTC